MSGKRSRMDQSMPGRNQSQRDENQFGAKMDQETIKMEKLNSDLNSQGISLEPQLDQGSRLKSISLPAGKANSPTVARSKSRCFLE